MKSDDARFWENVDKQSDDGCWLWTGTLRSSGYGRFYAKDFAGRAAHRWAYLQEVGPIPDGLEIDHLCRVRSCVNPRHLEVVTHGENMRRARDARTHCKHGHSFEEHGRLDRTARGYLSRTCRECDRIKKAVTYQSRKATAP